MIVLQYNKLSYEHPAISTIEVQHFNLLNTRTFDVALSISRCTFNHCNVGPQLLLPVFSLSSFDHDGLGRYGDPLNPDADIAAMKTVARVLKADGLLFLTIPIGKYVTDL